MTVWSWIYLALWPVAAVALARFILEGMARDGRTINAMARFGALVAGLAASVIWPFWAPFLLFWVGARRFLVTGHERRAAEAAKLALLRRQARELGLPIPAFESEERS
jgi:hypothetical protein